jgi:hypothetical protein
MGVDKCGNRCKPVDKKDAKTSTPFRVSNSNKMNRPARVKILFALMQKIDSEWRQHCV